MQVNNEVITEFEASIKVPPRLYDHLFIRPTRL